MRTTETSDSRDQCVQLQGKDFAETEVKNVCVEVRFHISFSALRLVTHVQLNIPDLDVPSILSNTDMIDNGLKHFCKSLHICLSSTPATDAQVLFPDLQVVLLHYGFVLYTEADLSHIHKGLGHPSVRATERLLRRRSGEPLDARKC